MRSIAAISASALFLLLGIPTLARARQDKPERQEEKAKPQKQEQPARPERKQQTQPAKPQQQAKPEQQRPQRQQADKSAKQQAQKPQAQQQAKGSQDQQRQQRQQQEKSAQQQKPQQQQQAKGHLDQQHQRHQQAGFSHAPQRTQQARARQQAQPQLRLSSRGSGRIPDDRFRSNFGRDHHFHMGNPVLVGGYSRFQYGGFWFGFDEPWPSDWYYTDDVYVDYVDGGYYMYNPYYPGARFEINVVL